MKCLNQQILENTLRNGGFTSNLQSEAPVSGFMVSIHPELETIIDLRNDKLEVLDLIDQFITKNISQLQYENNYIGSWICNYTIYLDVSIKIDNMAEVLSLAAANDQLAIFDLLTK